MGCEESETAGDHDGRAEAASAIQLYPLLQHLLAHAYGTVRFWIHHLFGGVDGVHAEFTLYIAGEVIVAIQLAANLRQHRIAFGTAQVVNTDQLRIAFATR